MSRYVVTALLLVACSSSAGFTQRGRKPVTHTVRIEGMLFVPSALTIKAGDSVVWVNKDIVEHTATASAPGGFDSRLIAAGKSWRHTFKSRGRFAYLCKYHPLMKGSLVVQ